MVVPGLCLADRGVTARDRNADLDPRRLRPGRIVALYLSWTAGRLDRLHARLEGARAALDAQLVRRASVAQNSRRPGVLDPASGLLLADAAHEARQTEAAQTARRPRAT